jgi:hypothetical protein
MTLALIPDGRLRGDSRLSQRRALFPDCDLGSLASALVTTKYGVPGLKYAMELNGYYGGPARLPLPRGRGSVTYQRYGAILT